MRRWIVYLLSLSLALPAPALAQSAQPAVKSVSSSDQGLTLKQSLLNWEQFTQLSKEERSLYIAYVFFVTAMVEAIHQPDDIVDFVAAEETAQYRVPVPAWLEALMANPEEADAAAPIVGLGVLAARGVYAAGRGMYNVYKGFRSGRSIFSRRPRVEEMKTPRYPRGGEPKPFNRSGAEDAVIVPPPSAPTAGVRALPRPTGRDLVPYSPKPPATVAPKPPAASPPAGGPPGGPTGLTPRQVGAGILTTAPLVCAVGEVCETKPTPTPSPTPEIKPAAEPPPAPTPPPPPIKREKGDPCIFAGYATSYSKSGDGGCSPPKESLNARECKGVGKKGQTTFKCNDFGLKSGGKSIGNQLCVAIKNRSELGDVTEMCGKKLLETMKRMESEIKKEDYEAMMKKLEEMLKHKPGKGELSVEEYCGSDFENARNAKDGEKSGRQAKECKALKDIRDQLAKGAPGVPAVAGPSAPTPAVTPSAAPPTGTR